jgi:hypothetical protein
MNDSKNEIKSAVHCITAPNAKGALRPYYMAAVGANPYGPRGGRAGRLVDGIFLKNWRRGWDDYFDRREHAQDVIDIYLATQVVKPK